VVCGTPTCEEPGLIWLEEAKARAYDSDAELVELAALHEPIEQLGHERVEAMRADAATGLP
jgi:hypothetical protein